MATTNTKEEITLLADRLIREKGYNAFSFYDISKTVGIKTASIHYHFPTKSDLVIAVIDQHIEFVKAIMEKSAAYTPAQQLEKFFSSYTRIKNEKQVCIVGSLATDLQTVDDAVRAKLAEFSTLFLDWVSGFLEAGRKNRSFRFDGTPRTKAIMIICSMLAIVQLSRLTGDKDFKTVKATIKQELLKK